MEQYHAQPMHAARIAFAHSGKIGTPTQAQISLAHGYHGISLIRRFLGIGYENATIRAQKFISPISKGPTKDGARPHEEIGESEQVIATLDFGDKLGVLDFTGDQYWSYFLAHRVLVRGERGEIADERATYMKDHTTPIMVNFERHMTGGSGNLEGHHLKGVQAGEDWVYTNPLAPAWLPDEEIATGTCLLNMADYAKGGAAFYPLAEACQDRYLDIKIWEAVDSGQPVTTETQIWAG